MTHAVRDAALVSVSLIAISSCTDHANVLAPERALAVAAAPDCFGRKANIYPGHPGPGSVTVSGAGFHMVGSAGPDVIVGGDNADIIEGGDGRDVICAGAGDDEITGGAGPDHMNGEGGTDEVRYAASPAGVRLSLAGGRGFGGDAEGDVVRQIEDAAGSDFDDVLLGNGVANTLFGLEGNDVLLGRAGVDALNGGPGDDYLEGGVGGDALNGGADVDLVDYSRSPVGVTVDLFNRIGTNGDADNDTYDGIENVHGSPHGDNITGDAAPNRLEGAGNADVLHGGDGDDVLIGGGSEDQLFGEGDNDTLLGNDSSDQLFGGAGDDLLRSGPGFDVVDGGDDTDTIPTKACQDIIFNVEVHDGSSCPT